jgi:hypothetical protein
MSIEQVVNAVEIAIHKLPYMEAFVDGKERRKRTRKKGKNNMM